MTTLTPVLTEKETITDIYLEADLINPTIMEIKSIVETIKKHPSYKSGSKFNVEFSEEVSVQRDKRNTIKTNEIKVRFFESSSGTFAYTFHSRSGYPLSYLDYRKITKLSYKIAKKPEEVRNEKVRKLLNRRFDETTWSNLTVEGLKYQKETAISIKRKFPNYVIKELTEAFENKTDYHYSKPGIKRDLSVSTKMGKDGVFRAWFSSEYADTGNGQYYLLLNPTTAAFCEWD